jgi:hypothetical protein
MGGLDGLCESFKTETKKIKTFDHQQFQNFYDASGRLAVKDYLELNHEKIINMSDYEKDHF